MTLPRLIAVIDIGKTNAKVVLIDSQSRQQMAVRSTPNTVVQSGIYPHADVERLWAFILASLGELQAAHGVDGISITTHGATAALMAGDELALPALDYEAHQPDETSLAYEGTGPDNDLDEHDQNALVHEGVRPDFAETLSPRLPVGLNLGAQIFWQSRAFPEQFAAVTHILTYPQYWAWRLTGVLASEVTSLGCHTDLWAPERGDFSSLVVEQGWRGLFPAVRPAASVLGPVRTEIAAKTGLAASTPVTCGIHDSNASLLPHLGGREAPFTILSTGTWVIAMTVGGDTGRLDPARDSLANVDAFGRPVPTARFMGGREFDLIADPDAVPTDSDIDRVLRNRMMVIPALTPGVGPFPYHRGGWSPVEPLVIPADLTGGEQVGFTIYPPMTPNMDHPPHDMSAGERNVAASLYLALMTQTCLGLCGLGREIVIEGPLARNALFGAALAALTGTRTSASGDATGTSLGASLLFGSEGHAAPEARELVPLAHEGLAAYAQAWRERIG